MRSALCTVFALLSLMLSGVSAAQTAPDAQTPVRVGITTIALPNPNQALIDRTLETLKKTVAPRQLVFRYYSPDDLARATNAEELDIVIASSGFYRRTLQKTGSRELASIISSGYPDPNGTDGAAIVVKADRTDLKTLRDLKGKTLSANTHFTFTGFLVPSAEIARLGEDPEHFFSKRLFKGEGRTMPLVAADVLEGRADAGFLRLCMLEELESRGEIPKGSLRVIQEKTAPGEPCRRSTPLYPGWTVSTTPNASSALGRAVTLAILQQKPAGEKGLQWGIATNYQTVDEVNRLLKIGPYEYLRSWTVQRFVNEYWWALLLFAAFTVLLAVHAWVVAGIAKQRSSALRKAMQRERELALEARETRDRMESLQKIWAVGQLSSALAHELRQPLTSISCLARGMVRFMERGELTEKITKDSLQLMTEQAKRASDVVERVRTYAKSPVKKNETLDFADVISRAVQGLQTDLSGSIAGKVSVSASSAFVSGDAVELEILARNLIKNALEAADASPEPHVEVTLSSENGKALFSVTDNGPALDAEALAALEKPLRSAKENGLGLGLAIVRTIAERHGGSLNFAPVSPHGLSVFVTIPLSEPPGSSEISST